jgi:hypothetical protein
MKIIATKKDEISIYFPKNDLKNKYLILNICFQLWFIIINRTLVTFIIFQLIYIIICKFIKTCVPIYKKI